MTGPADVKKKGGAAIAISPDSADLGQQAADMLIQDFERSSRWRRQTCAFLIDFIIQ